MPAWGSVLVASFVFLISFGNVGQRRASKTQAVININVGGHASRQRMKTDYEHIIVESFNPSDTLGRHGPTHVRPIPGQGLYKTDMFVECSKSLVTDYPIGTRFKIKAKITDREGGTPFIYSHYSWSYEVVKKIVHV